MATWILLEEFAEVVGKSVDEVRGLCDEGFLEHKEEGGRLYVDVGSGTQLVLQSNILPANEGGFSASFAEKTIGTILAFHEKVIEAKDETLDVLKEENRFLKEGLISMQEVYDADRKTIEALTKQLQSAQDDLEFTKRKYKLMWGQVVENHTK
ncbi:MAG TPA: DUF3972 domain-containing protein [Campylobacterales bacterium]|nr:DUF3972 domain-containing protein [Campylobacterales bacterium]